MLTSLVLVGLSFVDPYLAVHQSEAERWTFYLDEEQTQAAEFVPEPVFVWRNEVRANGQQGACYVWTHAGRVVAFGGTFSNPESGRRVVMHEFHAVGPHRLYPVQSPLDGMQHQWLPGAGAPLKPLKADQPPASAETLRNLQLRQLARQFTAHLVTASGERYPLRLLPKPVYRYQHPQGDVVDGAVWVFATDEGTDPEIILCIEAVRDGDEQLWQHRLMRFSFADLYVERDGEPFWSSLRDDPSGPYGNPDNTFGVVRDRLIDEPARTNPSN